MLSLHQLRCFLTAYDAGSLSGAAEQLGYAQPSVSEQIRTLERALGVQLFTRAGRGVQPTSAAEALRPHAERTLAAAEAARAAVRSVDTLETGTIRFGVFGIARLYLSATLVRDVLERHPGVRVELIGQNSTEVTEDLRRGRLEAAIVTSPADSHGLTVVPVARDELVYASIHPDRVATPVTARRLVDAELVLPEVSWRATDSGRTILRRLIYEAGLEPPTTRVEVEDVETAVEVMGAGLADTILPRAAAGELLPRLAPRAHIASLRPRQYDTFAIVHRAGATLSPATRLLIQIATRRIHELTDPLG